MKLTKIEFCENYDMKRQKEKCTKYCNYCNNIINKTVQYNKKKG